MPGKFQDCHQKSRVSGAISLKIWELFGVIFLLKFAKFQNNWLILVSDPLIYRRVSLLPRSFFPNEKNGIEFSRRFRKPWLRVKAANVDFIAKLSSTDYNESNKSNPKSLAHIGSKKSLVELGVP